VQFDGNSDGGGEANSLVISREDRDLKQGHFGSGKLLPLGNQPQDGG
jgi:hypothetical protein